MVLWTLLTACVTPEPTVVQPEVLPPVEVQRATPVAPLTLLVVVDQLPVRLLALPAEKYTGGLKRLTGPEATTHTARYSHAVTYTGPGHATISTGRSPSKSGIVSNDWRRRDDPTQNVYCGDAALLEVPTLADQVVKNGGKVATLAIKDRAAILLGGSSPTSVVFWDKKAEDLNGAMKGRVDLDAYLRPWEALFPDDYARWVGLDADADELAPGTLGNQFPHPVESKSLLPITPWGGDLLVDAALLTAEDLALGDDDHPDLLAVSFSHTDYIGHYYTAESWEAVDGMIRLDRSLQRLIDGLEERVGDRGLSVVLTSDHGVMTAKDSHRIGRGTLEAAAQAAYTQAGLPGEVVLEMPTIYLPAELSDEDRTKGAKAVAAALSKDEGLAAAWAWRTDAPPPPAAKAIRDGLHAERSGDVYVMRASNALFQMGKVAGQGSSHGTAFPEDTDVPLLMWGTGVTPAPSRQVDVRQVAPTVAGLMGVKVLPDWMDGVQ